MTACKPLPRLLSVLLLVVLMTGCGSNGSKSSATDKGQPEQSGMTLNTLVKTDMDMVYDHHIRIMDSLLRDLMVKLYLRNPRYFRQYGYASAEARVKALYDTTINQQISLLKKVKSVDAIRLTFDEGYQGDRVAAFVLGLRTMLDDAHGNQRQFYLFDQLDPQRLYNAARNIEVAVWKLSHDRQSNGELFLISNEVDGETKNLSFERLFGKLIALQDDTAQLNANATNRTIKNVIQGVAKYVFLPI